MTTIMMGKMEMELPDMDDEQIHGNLFEGAQSKIPAPFNPKVGVSLPGGICMYQCASCRTETRGRGELHILT